MSEHPIGWPQARQAVYEAAATAAPPAVPVPIGQADGLTLGAPLVTLTDLPAFATSSVDGWATRGAGPWRVLGQALAGATSAPLTEDGTCVEIATGAMVPPGADRVVRVEDSERDGDHVVANAAHAARNAPEWREVGEEARGGEELLPAGTAITPGVLGLAASCGYDELLVRPAPKVAVLVFGDELLTAGPPGAGRVRDALGPSLPGWLRRIGASPVPGHCPLGPVPDTLDAHVSAVLAALDAGATLVCTTGGTMNGPVDHLHPTLEKLGARYVVNTVAVRPGYPMLVAALPAGRFVAGLPGNPQSAVVALMSLVAPLVAGLTGRSMPPLGSVTLGAPIRSRGSYTHLALVRRDPTDGLAYPVEHAGSAMLRGLAQSIGFAVVAPQRPAAPGDVVPLVPLPSPESAP